MKNYSINTEKDKNSRKQKINNFVSKLGNGKKGLTKSEIDARIEKILGKEKEKVKNYGKNKNSGVDFYKDFKKHQSYREGSDVKGNILPKFVMDNINQFPKDIRSSDEIAESRIINIDVKQDGCIELTGLILNGNENDPLLKQTYGVLFPSDEDHARMEVAQFKNKQLKEVSDRTMKIHEENGLLDQLLEDSEIDTDEDKEIQY